MKFKEKIALVSVSGGKDSTATLLVAMEQFRPSRIFPVFADTGNEHEEVYRYLEYLARETGLGIKALKADFTEKWWSKRSYVDREWRAEKVPAEIVSEAMRVLDGGPTGNPYLDLCVIKGRFPSRTAQFCTQELKKFPLQNYSIDLMLNWEVESWQGVRRSESASRAKLPEREKTAEGFAVYRPIIDWTVEQVFAKHREHGIEPNPLYKKGMSRVGCMPCINCSKDELLQIAKRFPKEIERIRRWEKVVSAASKRGCSTFFYAEGASIENPRSIHDAIAWAKTERGGKQFDIFRMLEPAVECESAYGLCEVVAPQDPR